MLYRRRFVAALIALAAVGTVAISLLLPLWYRAETRMLLPEEGSSAYSVTNDLAPGAAALLGGGGYMRYLSILTSRTLLDRAVETFDLERL